MPHSPPHRPRRRRLGLGLLVAALLAAAVPGAARADITPGVYVIHPRITYDRVLGVSGGATANGSNVNTYWNVGAAYQRWIVEAHGQYFGQTLYSLKPAHASSKCLDIAGASTQPYAPAIIWPCHFGGNQLFRIAAFGPEPYWLNIVPAHSGLLVFTNLYGTVSQGRHLPGNATVDEYYSFQRVG